MYVRAGRPAFARPCVGIHKSTSLMSSSLLQEEEEEEEEEEESMRLWKMNNDMKKRNDEI